MKYASRFFLVILIWTHAPFLVAEESAPSPAPSWSEWVESKESETPPIIVRRTIERSGRFQLSGPGFGLSARQDLYSHQHIALGLKYFFSETHGWEILRGNWHFSSLQASAEEVVQRTGYQVEGSPAQWSLGTHYLFVPIYGKYAWGKDSVVHFDGFASLGLGLQGVRSDRQIYGEVGIGMSHYLGRHFALVPEIRTRLFTDGAKSDLVAEVFFLLGAAWLF